MDRAPSSLLAAGAVAFFVARMLISTEAADQGESLWVTQCWLFLAFGWVIDAFRRGRLRLRCDKLDLAVGALVVGHVLSATVVLLSDGNRRMALNMLWEWVGLGVSFVLLRQIIETHLDARRFLWSMTSVVAVLAALGLYQHFVMMPAEAARFQQTSDRLEQLKSGSNSASSLQEYQEQQREIQRLQRELPAASLNDDGTIRKAFQDRLLSSTEPFGPFALANTFAGLLGVGLIPLLALLANGIRQRRGWPAIAGAAAVTIVVAYCLLLTKSRTAWVGVAGGIAIWLWLSRRTAGSQRFNVMAWGLGAAVTVGVIAVIAAATGGIDRKTVSESPKSLRYRLQYWTGTIAVLRERPVFGAGPGNFRQHYMKHKVPEASEEIRDPHNLILDAWVSGGLLALVGLAGVIVIGVSLLRRPPSDVSDDSSSDNKDRDVDKTATAYSSGTWIAGTVGGFVLVLLANKAFDQQWNPQLLALLAGCLFVQWILTGIFSRATISPGCVAGAWGALLIHLLGAGGMEYPAIVQLLLVAPVLLLRVSAPPESAPEPVSAAENPGNRSLVWIWLAVVGTMCGLCATTAVWQVQLRKWLVAAGESEWRERGKMRSAEGFFAQAAAADPLSPEPTARLAQLAFIQWHKGGGRNDELFEAAIDRQKIAIQQDPNSSSRYRVLGKWYAVKYAKSRNPDDAKLAVSWFEESLKRYPNHSAVVAEFAIFLSSANGYSDEAVANARRAIELDGINRNAGHTDRVLPESLRKRLEAIREPTERL